MRKTKAARKRSDRSKSPKKRTGSRSGSGPRFSGGLKIPKKWVDIILAIPGYDPIKTAGNCYFDVPTAEMAISFFPNCLSHVKGKLAGKPFKLEKWQKAIVANIFGWKRPDGTRRYREVFIYVPRKNGKTTVAAGIVNLILFTDNEPGAEIYSAAADRDQARLVFDQAAGMVRNEDRLYSRGTVYQKAIVRNDGTGSYKPISADANTKHGYNVHAAIIDELHAQPNRDLVDALTTATGARKQPLIIHITTADFDRPSICNEKHDYAIKVRDGIIDDRSFLPVIYEMTVEDDWTKKRNWKKANPNLGISVARAYLEREFKRAQEVPAYENTFKRLHLNMKTEQAVRWLPLEKWDECGVIEIPDNQLNLVEWYAGLDLASTTDIAAFVLYSPDNDAVFPTFWIPRESAYIRERRDRVPYLTWANQGLIRMTDGNVIDYDVILRDIFTLAGRFKINEIAVDRWGSQHIQTQLAGEGLEVVPFGQGFASMSAPAKELEKLVVGGSLRHNNNQVLRWMASNVSIEMDAAGNIKASKKKSTERIDGIVALLMAIGRAIAQDPESGRSVYETQGIKVL